MSGGPHAGGWSCRMRSSAARASASSAGRAKPAGSRGAPCGGLHRPDGAIACAGGRCRQTSANPPAVETPGRPRPRPPQAPRTAAGPTRKVGGRPQARLRCGVNAQHPGRRAAAPRLPLPPLLPGGWQAVQEDALVRRGPAPALGSMLRKVVVGAAAQRHVEGVVVACSTGVSGGR